MNLIADRMSLCKSYVSELERGQRNWNQELIDQYNDALNGKPLAKRIPLQKLVSQKP